MRPAERLLRLRAHDGVLVAAAFDRGGRTIRTHAADATIRQHDCEICGGIEELRALAEARLRTLTPR